MSTGSRSGGKPAIIDRTPDILYSTEHRRWNKALESQDVWDHLNYYHTFREACRHVEQVPDQWQAAYRVRVTFILRFNYFRE